MVELTLFRVVFLGSNYMIGGRTRQVEAVDISAASAQLKGISPSREYLILPESQYVEGDPWWPDRRRGRRPPAGSLTQLRGYSSRSHAPGTSPK